MILVLGASSYVGKHIYAYLGGTEAMGTHNKNPLPHTVHFDSARMCIPELGLRPNEVSHAFICFGETRMDECKTNADQSYELNVSRTKRVIDDLVSANIKPIFFSSDYVFDGTKGNYSENDAPNPITAYGAHKYEVERYISDHYSDYLILRLSKIIGSESGDGRLPSIWHQQIQRGEEVCCDDEQSFSPIHIEDVVAAATAAVKLDLSGLFNLGGGESVTRVELFRRLRFILAVDTNLTRCSISDFDFEDNRPLDISLDSRKILAATNLEFKSIDSSCREFADSVSKDQPKAKTRT